MRPYEYHKKHYEELLNKRVQAERQSLGLFCPFQDQTASNEVWRYNFEELRKTVQCVCDETGRDFQIVGQNVSSIDWMDEVMRLALSSHIVVVDVTNPRYNLMYELGIACSLRSSASVIITRYERPDFSCSEVEQLEMLEYSDFPDLKIKLIEHLKSSESPIESELDSTLERMHDRFSPDAMHLLIFMKQSREYHVRRNESGWHISYATVQGGMSLDRFLTAARELLAASLARFDYEFNLERMSMGYALHPTTLGERYISSKSFLKFVCKGDALIQVTQNRLLGLS